MGKSSDSALRALDISKHQSTFAPQTAKAAGISVVILRAAYGGTRDVRFERFAADCRAAGLATGAYIFLTHHYYNKNKGSVETARAILNGQIDALLETLAGQGVTSWVALDQELEAGQTMALAPAENTALLNEAAARLRQAGYAPCVYCSASWAKSRLDVERLDCPLWLAYYYADPDDPDFDDCAALENLNTAWGEYTRSLGHKLCGWQFGRIGYGAKYGVGSANVDKDFIYREDKPMAFEPTTGKQLRCTSAANPKCETFSAPDINASLGALELDQVCEITAKGGTVDLAGMTGTWYKIIDDGTEVYCLDLPDGRCVVEDVPEEPEGGLEDVLAALARAYTKLEEVLAATARLEAGQKALMDRINAIYK